jgi:2'-5' RNA ligase
MKHYIIILMPEKVIQESIKNFRMQYMGVSLIDGLPPHITLKQRFYLRDGVIEDDLKKIFNKIDIKYASISLNGVEMLNDAFVLRGSSDYIREKYLEIRKALANSVIDVRPEFEGDNYKIHLTLWRGMGIESSAGQYRKEIGFDRICLYEIDPTAERAFANKVACKDLADKNNGE